MDMLLNSVNLKIVYTYTVTASSGYLSVTEFFTIRILNKVAITFIIFSFMSMYKCTSFQVICHAPGYNNRLPVYGFYSLSGIYC